MSNNYMLREELREIAEGLIDVYLKQSDLGAIQSIDIEDFIKSFLKLSIQYVAFAEADTGRIGFLADGETPLIIMNGGECMPCVFPKNTIVIDQSLLAEKETGRRRFTLAHEAAHHILSKINFVEESEKDNEKQEKCTVEELSKTLSSIEWQADIMAASLLMPEGLVEQTMYKILHRENVILYGGGTIAVREKMKIKEMARIMGVSFTSLLIRLRDMDKFEYRSIEEYISKELNLGGGYCGATAK